MKYNFPNPKFNLFIDMKNNLICSFSNVGFFLATIYQCILMPHPINPHDTIGDSSRRLLVVLSNFLWNLIAERVAVSLQLAVNKTYNVT